MGLDVVDWGGLAYFWAPHGCIGWARVDRDGTLSVLHVSRGAPDELAREVMRIVVEMGARRAVALGAMGRVLEAHGWTKTSEMTATREVVYVRDA